jgi:hypothetical protein
VPFHNSPSNIQRGNIIVWEQSMAERINGQPLTIEAHLEPQSILFRTLTLFAFTIVLALATFALAIWWVMRRNKGSAAGGQWSGVRPQAPGNDKGMSS